MSDRAVEDQVSLLSTKSVRPSPGTLTSECILKWTMAFLSSETELIKRIRALTLTLLPLEVSTEEIANPTSRIITPAVISAYIGAAGDFGEAVGRAHVQTAYTLPTSYANHDTADYGENIGRAIACETLARRMLHTVPPERLDDVMSTRFQHTEWDGDPSALSSALELAIDQRA
ncbi:hypothetical protein FRC10_005143 [Ceratobasidium sp. 414]|nr:hypothetical protein FRC10_005143 [Ceratobasidium sp. 414]